MSSVHYARKENVGVRLLLFSQIIHLLLQQLEDRDSTIWIKNGNQQCMALEKYIDRHKIADRTDTEQIQQLTT